MVLEAVVLDKVGLEIMVIQSALLDMVELEYMVMKSAVLDEELGGLGPAVLVVRTGPTGGSVSLACQTSWISGAYTLSSVENQEFGPLPRTLWVTVSIKEPTIVVLVMISVTSDWHEPTRVRVTPPSHH